MNDHANANLPGLTAYMRELETLRRLQARCAQAIDLIETGQVRGVPDPGNTALPYDFRIGEFGVVNIDRRRCEADAPPVNSIESEEFFDLCQEYRHASYGRAQAAYEALIKFIDGKRQQPQVDTTNINHITHRKTI